MAGLRARALYDFEGDTSQNELVFFAGDVINIVRQDIGEGWWEGAVGDAPAGLLPASYVEVIEEVADTTPAAPPAAPVPAPPMAQPEPPELEEGDWSSDEDNEEEWHEGSDDDHGPAHEQSGPVASDPGAGGPAGAGTGGIHRGGKKGATMKSKHWGIRGSAYVKAGTEEYMLHGTAKKGIKINPEEKIQVLDTKGQGPGWSENSQNKEVKVYHAGKKNPKKSFKGTHTHYNITCTPGGSTVERRFKHFEWLFERLTTKYTCLCVPPLPDFKFPPKFGEDAIKKKEERLQRWMTRVMRHPVLSRDMYSLKHFIETPYSDGKDWKSAKKHAEKDDKVGGAFFDMVETDTQCPADAMRTINNFGKFHDSMLKAVNKAYTVSSNHSNRMFQAFRKEYLSISESLKNMGAVIASGDPNNGNSIKLSIAFDKASATMSDIGELVARQPINDEIPMMENLKEYQAMLTQFDLAIKSSQTADKKLKTVSESPDLPPMERQAYKERLDNIHTVTLCEIHHFHESMKSDFKVMLTDYLGAQIAHHKQIIEQLEGAKAGFDNLPF